MTLNTIQMELVHRLNHNQLPTQALRDYISDMFLKKKACLAIHKGTSKNSVNFYIEFEKKSNIDELLFPLHNVLDSMLSLIHQLENNNLVLSFQTSISENSFLTDRLQISSSASFCLNDCKEYILLTKKLQMFYTKEIIPLPILREFEEEMFKTLQEKISEIELNNREQEIKLLKRQTAGVLVGVGITAIITLVAAFMAHPNTKDIKMITESINQLSTKVEKLNDTQKQDESNVTESWFVMPEDPIKTFSIPQDIN